MTRIGTKADRTTRNMKHGERSADFRVGGPRFLSSHFSYLALDPLYRRGRGDRGAPIKLRPNGLGRWRFVARATYLHGVYAATRPPWRKRVFSRRWGMASITAPRRWLIAGHGANVWLRVLVIIRTHVIITVAWPINHVTGRQPVRRSAIQRRAELVNLRRVMIPSVQKVHATLSLSLSLSLSCQADLTVSLEQRSIQRRK